MKKIGIITLNGDFNFGNKLQNYALREYLITNYECEVYTLWTNDYKNSIFIKNIIKFLLRNKYYLRTSKFKKFNKYLNVKSLDYQDNYDNYIIGSDQVWNLYDPVFNEKKYFALFAPKSKNISYAASIGTNQIPNDKKEMFINGINNINTISVREEKGKDIIKEMVNRDAKVLIDPTMLLSSEQWDKISKKPKKICKKYILNYFLGELSDEINNEIHRIALENDCEIINILDKNDKYYISGPEEFLWLEKNAFAIFTDSFHSCVFAILFNRPFIVFDRQDKIESMGSRIDTLLFKFKLENRKYNGKMITKENLEPNYNEAFKILNEEKALSKKFFDDIL